MPVKPTEAAPTRVGAVAEKAAAAVHNAANQKTAPLNVVLVLLAFILGVVFGKLVLV